MPYALCPHDAYRWICGGVEVSAHTLSDFRVAHRTALDELLTQSVGLHSCNVPKC